jgi:hypothetical protein
MLFCHVLAVRTFVLIQNCGLFTYVTVYGYKSFIRVRWTCQLHSVVSESFIDSWTTQMLASSVCAPHFRVCLRTELTLCCAMVEFIMMHSNAWGDRPCEVNPGRHLQHHAQSQLHKHEPPCLLQSLLSTPRQTMQAFKLVPKRSNKYCCFGLNGCRWCCRSVVADVEPVPALGHDQSHSRTKTQKLHL